MPQRVRDQLDGDNRRVVDALPDGTTAQGVTDLLAHEHERFLNATQIHPAVMNAFVGEVMGCDLARV
nr:hypothetical protein [Streptomyces antibioticus]